MQKISSTFGIIATVIILGLILIVVKNRGLIFEGANLEDLKIGSKYILYYKKACELNDKKACLELGNIYKNGYRGVSIDHKRAVEFYKKACNLNSPIACNNLAYIYNLNQENRLAFKYYKKACKLNSLIGCYNLGSMYYYGEGTKRSRYKAKVLFEMVCKNGIGAGCNDLGYMYAHGIYVKRDILKALSLYSDACQYGEGSACGNLGILYSKGALGVSKDRVKAEQYFSIACKLNDLESCDRLQSIRDITTVEDFNIAKKICDRGVKSGCYRLGELYTKDNIFVKRY